MDAKPEIDPLSHRARKIAGARIAIARELERRLETEEFADVKVEDLAAAGGVSRATLFNYFSSKEQILDFVAYASMYCLQVEVRRRGLEGRAAIEFAFAHRGEQVAKSPRAVSRVAGAIGPNRRPMLVFTVAERALLAPGEAIDESPSVLGQFFQREIRTARERGEIDLTGTDFELAHYLGALIAGAVLVGHSTKGLDWAALHRAHCARALGPCPPRRGKRT